MGIPQRMMGASFLTSVSRHQVSMRQIVYSEQSVTPGTKGTSAGTVSVVGVDIVVKRGMYVGPLT